MTTHSICILGGTGFVGRSLASRLSARGDRVTILTRHRERHRDLLVLPGVRLIEIDVYDGEALARELRGHQAAVNLIGILNEKGHNGRGFYKAHVEAPRTLVKACRSVGVRRLLHMSALNADAVHGPSFYLRTKGEGEDLVHASGLQVTSFQPSVIFGPGDSLFRRFAHLLRITPGVMPLACAKTRFQPVYVGDVAEAIASAISRRATFGQRYALCGPRVYTLQEIVEYTAHLLHLQRYVVPLGEFLSGWQARLLEFAPGKPFSLDNYRTMSLDSICSRDFPAIFGAAPASVEEIVPCYINRNRP